METIETRLPNADRWVKHVTAVAERAKTGYDWQGDFYHANQLVDLEPGSLIADCDQVGSRKHPEDGVAIRVLLPTGEWLLLASERGKEWASALRKKAREWLALGADARVRRAVEEGAAEWRRKLQGREERLSGAREVRADLPRKLDEALEKKTRYFEVDVPAARSTAPAKISQGYLDYDEAGAPKGATRDEILERLRGLADKRIAEIEEAVAEARGKLAELEALLEPAPPAPPPATPEDFVRLVAAMKTPEEVAAEGDMEPVWDEVLGDLIGSARQILGGRP